VEKVEIPLRLRDFQAQWESPALGLFHGAACSTALLPINCRAHPEGLNSKWFHWKCLSPISAGYQREHYSLENQAYPSGEPIFLD
jgi:hypothetical protein